MEYRIACQCLLGEGTCNTRLILCYTLAPIGQTVARVPLPVRKKTENIGLHANAVTSSVSLVCWALYTRSVHGVELSNGPLLYQTLHPYLSACYLSASAAMAFFCLKKKQKSSGERQKNVSSEITNGETLPLPLTSLPAPSQLLARKCVPKSGDCHAAKRLRRTQERGADLGHGTSFLIYYICDNPHCHAGKACTYCFDKLGL